MKNKNVLPLIAGSLFLASGATIAKPNAHDFFNKFDKDNNGQISLAEFNSNSNESFARIDSDGSGVFGINEFKQYNEQRKAEYKKKKIARYAELKKQKFKTLDANADGTLTKNEFVSAAISKAEQKAVDKFSKLDGNNADGKVTEQEFMHNGWRKDRSKEKSHDKKGDRHGKKAHGGEKMFSRMDANNNGDISPKEYKQSRLNWFNKLDADKNGSVSQSELKQAHSDRRKK